MRQIEIDTAGIESNELLNRFDMGLSIVESFGRMQ